MGSSRINGVRSHLISDPVCGYLIYLGHIQRGLEDVRSTMVSTICLSLANHCASCIQIATISMLCRKSKLPYYLKRTVSAFGRSHPA